MKRKENVSWAPRDARAVVRKASRGATVSPGSENLAQPQPGSGSPSSWNGESSRGGSLLAASSFSFSPLLFFQSLYKLNDSQFQPP